MGSRRKAFIAAGCLLAVGLAYWMSGLGKVDINYLRELGESSWTPIILIASMALAWALALPASAFFFIVPVFYEPLASTFIMTIGNLIGGIIGYIFARYIGGAWIENHRDHKITRFLERNAGFFTMFAIRVAPSSPHGLINYGAGLVQMPMLTFLSAAAGACAIKAFVYASVVDAAVDATSIGDVLTWNAFAILVGCAALAMIGRWVRMKWKSKPTI
ncbi:MAG: VTT domain-containing protein [Bacteroidota bacterium]